MVLTTDKTSLGAIVNSPECGISVEHNAYSYAKELQRLMENTNEVQERGAKSLEFARLNYDMEIHIERLISIYQDVIKMHSDDAAPESELIINQLVKYNKDYRKKSVLKKICSRMKSALYQIRYFFRRFIFTLLVNLYK
jgi:hypothetical protein